MSYSLTVEESHLAVVTANKDPEELGQIRVACQGLLDGEDEDLPMWIKPYPMWGWFVVPDVGETVEIVTVVGASDDETPGAASIANPNIRWRGTRLWGGTETASPRPVPDAFKTNYPKRRGFATPAGLIIWFDDTPGAEAIELKWTNEKGDAATVSMDPNGSIVLVNKTGSTVAMDAIAKTVVVADENGNQVKMESGLVTVKSPTKVKIDAPAIELGGAGQASILGDALVTYLGTHTHAGVTPGPGVTGPPVAGPVGVTSTVVKLG